MTRRPDWARRDWRPVVAIVATAAFAAAALLLLLAGVVL